MKKYIYIIGLLLFLWSCQEDEVMQWQGKTCIYFSYMDPTSNDKFSNDMGFSFGLTNSMDTVIYIPVTGSGDVVDYERTFSYVIDSVTGVEGVHYDPLPAKGVFPANSATGYIPVSLHRILDDDSLYYMHLRLISDENFEVNIPEAYEDSDTTDLTRLTFSYSSAIAKPTYWMDSFLGYFSLAKYQVVYELTGQTWQSRPNAMLMVAWGQIVQTYIESRILEGKDAALRDPSNHYPGEEGYMTMRGKSGAMTIPAEWFDE